VEFDALALPQLEGHTVSSEAVTRDIRVQVETEPDPDRTFPDLGRWFYRYTVTITNQGSETVTLRDRHWIITDGRGNVEEVRGPGVVGYQPILEPGQSFQYTSACPLPTPVGTMRGTYRLVTDEGESFEAEIATFQLAQPELIN
jgi:ApaG protein